MKNTIQLLGITLFGAAVLAACGDDTSNTGGGPAGGGNPQGGNNPTTGGSDPQGGGGNGAGGSGGSGDFPEPPEPGAQIDRMGRPAINTALVGAFVQYDDKGAPIPAVPEARAALQDDYNADTTEADWADTYGPLFAGNLAVLDALDTGLDPDGPGGDPPLTNGEACINQGGSAGSLASPANYGTLALVLPNDKVFVSVAGQNCSANAPASPLEGYLGVELAVLGNANTGCGGRRPVDDVIKVTYSLLAIGAPLGFDDGIDPRPGQHPETFPYMADPATND
jgi:hypothetical protein